MPATDDTAPAIHILVRGVRDGKRRYLRLDHLLHRWPRINSQHQQQQRSSTIRDLGRAKPTTLSSP